MISYRKARTEFKLLGIGYFIYAYQRWGFREAVSRWWEYELRGRLLFKGTRRRYRNWKRRDRRERKSWGAYKLAIDRDGDLYLVECPICHNQSVHWNRDKNTFTCGWDNQHQFTVYTEDGVRECRDHRDGNIQYFPIVAVRDEALKVWRIGIKDDAPWWWKRREIYRDLQPNGKDGHGHQRYEVLSVVEKQEVAMCEPEGCR